MALTSPINSGSRTGATPTVAPTPYRVSTEAVRFVSPPTVDTVTLKAIRARIEPNENFWQFPLPRIPWQVSLALGVYSAVVGLGVVAISFAVYLGAHR